MRMAERLVILAIQVYLTCLIPLVFFQRSLIYHPSRSASLPAAQAISRTSVIDIRVKSHDGLTLNGWLLIAGNRTGKNESEALNLLEKEGNPVILYFPGNAGQRSRRLVPMEVLTSLNAHVVLVDYRGYGDNPGTPSEASFANDARSVWNYLTAELNVSPRRIVIYGESLGGGVATRLAGELCKSGIEPGGLIVQSTFNSLVAVAQKHFPVLPISLLLVDRYPSDRRINSVTCPILQIHGQQDQIVPLENGQRLFDAAPAASTSGIAKQQIVMPTTDHNDVYDSQRDSALLQEGLRDFLEQVQSLSTRPPDPSAEKEPDSPLSNVTSPAQAGQSVNLLDRRVVMAGLLLAFVAALELLKRQRSPRTPTGGDHGPPTK